MKTIRLMVLFCFVLGLASVFPMPSAVAQSLEVCPGPPELPAPPANLVTAAQVENGDATLAEFMLGFLQYATSVFPFPGATGYLGCLMTHEGPLNSGATYFVGLTLSGRVELHGKNVILSGGLLDSDILAQISAAASSSLTGGLFMAEAKNAAGYAVNSIGSDGITPTFLVAGFDLQESHLVPEVTDPGDVPAVTARDVVDRETLKAFVNGALEYQNRLYEAEGWDASLKSKRVFRDPNGPWRHGPIYLFIINHNGFTLFHGAFPEKYELQTPTDTLRDAVTGELILPKIIEAAAQNPEGGFVEYHFDNPDDDTDSAEILKVTYAREHTFMVNVPGVGQQTRAFIVGSGFYKGNQVALDFAQFANGTSYTSDLVLVNVADQPVRPAIYFYDPRGNLIDPASVVDIMGDLMVTDYGALTVQMEMEPLGELTISTHGQGDLVDGSVKVISDGPDSPIGGVLRFDLPGIGVAGVGASQPVRDALFPVRREGELSTAAAIRNLSESELVVTCRLMKEGTVLEEMEIPLAANGQEAQYIEEMFTNTDTSDFVGSVRCTVPPGEQEFTGVAVELDVGNRIFTTLPVVPVEGAAASPE